MAHLLSPEIKEIYARRLNNSIQISRNKIDQITDEYIDKINNIYAQYKKDVIYHQREFEKKQQQLLKSAQENNGKLILQNSTMYENLSAARENVDSGSMISENPWKSVNQDAVNSRRERYKRYKQNLDNLGKQINN